MLREEPIPSLRDKLYAWCIGDVRQPSSELESALRGCDVLFHCAANFSYSAAEIELIETATDGTRNMLFAAHRAGVQRVVITSSSVVFGSSGLAEIRDEGAGVGLNERGFREPAYVISKIRQHQVAREVANSLGIDLILACPTMSIGRPTRLLGPSNAAIVAYWADPLRMTFPGGCNFVSARDVAVGHRILALRGLPGEDYVLGSENLHWQQFHEKIARLCGIDGPKVRINHTLAFGGALLEQMTAVLVGRPPLTTTDQARMVGRYYWYAHSKAAELGYSPNSADIALAEACAWLAASEHISPETRASLLLNPSVHAARANFMSG